MSLNIRKFDLIKDGESVRNWWKTQEWASDTVHVISDSGFMVEDGLNKIAATWIIKTNSPIYLMEWTVGNPEISWEKRKNALEQLTEYACNWAKQDGAKAVLVMTKNNRYIDKLKNTNFVESDKDMTHLIRSL